MPIPVACQCGAKFAAQDHLAGKSVKCPRCGQPLKIPGGAAPSGPSAPQAAAPVASVGSILDEFGVQSSQTGVTCPKCGADMQPGAVICVQCGYDVRKGKQVRQKSDTLTAQRREEVFRKQREAAEKAGRAQMDKHRTSGTVESLGGVVEASTAIITRPSIAFARLSREEGTYAAIEYAFTAALVAGLVWLAYYTLFFLSIPLRIAAEKPELAEDMAGLLTAALPAYGLGVGVFAGVYLVSVAVGIFGTTALLAGISHLVLKHLGESDLPFTATYRCYIYFTGAMYIIGSIPCLNFFGLIFFLVIGTLGLAAHHRVSGGIAFLAVFLALMGALILFLLLYLTAGAALLVLLRTVAPPEQF